MSNEYSTKDIKGVGNVLDSVTPFIGYRYSNIDIDMGQKIRPFPGVNADINFSANGSNSSAVLGAQFNFKNDLSASVGVSLIDEKGLLITVVKKL